MELNADDLKVARCEKCGGLGDITRTEESESGGFGRHTRSYSNQTCPECKGRGLILTPTGEALLEFLKSVRPLL